MDGRGDVAGEDVHGGYVFGVASAAELRREARRGLLVVSEMTLTEAAARLLISDDTIKRDLDRGASGRGLDEVDSPGGSAW